MSATMSMSRPCSDPDFEACRLGRLVSLAFYLSLAFLLTNQPNFFKMEAAVPEPGLIKMEIIDLPVPELAPEPVPEIAPEPEPIVEPEPEPIVEPPPPPQLPAAKPKPTPKPKPDLKPKAETKPAPKPKAEAKPVPPRASAQASAPKVNKANFVSDFTRAVERNKFYPKAARRAGVTGTVKVRVTFDGQGRITGASLIPGSYDPVLGEAALTTINKVRQRWAPKGGGPSSLVVPIGFRLK